MKFLLFGTGNYYDRYKKWFAKEDVLALLDNSPQKHNTFIDGIRVLPPEKCIALDFDAIVILSFYVKEMREQLIGLGVQESKIHHFYDLHKLIYSCEIKKPVQYYGCAERDIKERYMPSRERCTKRILLLSQDLELGGPALALLHAAIVLKKQGYQVIFASMIDGALRDKLLEYDIPVVIDVNLQIQTMEETEWIKNFDLIFCNTINYHVFLSKRDNCIPVIWWIHDSLFFYHGVKKETLQSIDMTNLNVCSVGPVPEQAIHNFLPELPVKRLLYGVENTSEMIGGSDKLPLKDEKICFVTIGYIENRKAQDVLVQAILSMPEQLRERAEFYFVGQNTSALAQQLMSRVKNVSEIIITGPVDRKRINEILNRADMLICPSREDPMPTVCAEAMLHNVPCLVSDATGTAEYIDDGCNGLVFQNENVSMLAEKITWCIANKEKLQTMGKHARVIYDKFFSMDVFEQKLMELVSISLDV